MIIYQKAMMLLVACTSTVIAAMDKEKSIPDASPADPVGIVVFQSDFGLADGAVAAMRGVALNVDQGLKLENLTHDIPPYNIWEGAYRLHQAAAYWPVGTVFVSVVDPGVGTSRRSIVARIGDQYFVTPDNGTLSLVGQQGINAVREIDETRHRIRGSTDSHTFHGRDVYAYTGARLAAGVISFEEVGGVLAPTSLVRLAIGKPRVEAGALHGAIPVLDVRYGNVWTNIPRNMALTNKMGQGTRLRVQIRQEDKTVFDAVVPYTATFGDVATGSPLIYTNSLERLALALNQENFANRYGVESGPGWTVTLRPAD